MRSGHLLTIDRLGFRFSYLFLGLVLFGAIGLSPEAVDRLRSKAASVSSFFWKSLSPQAAGISFPARSTALPIQVSDKPFDAHSEALQEAVSDQRDVQRQAERLAALFGSKEAEKLGAAAKKHLQEYRDLLAMRYAAMPAQVIFRDPAFWSSSLWISVGEVNNRAAQKTVVGKNSPVLAHGALIGVVEYVGESQSRVRLISDAGVAIAVRAMRGGTQNRELIEHVRSLRERIEVRPDLFSSAEEQARFLSWLLAFEDRIKPSWEDEMLAKGELRGSSAPLWRSQGSSLKGSGFNYDYSDENGPARDLRTGRPIGAVAAKETSLLREGDLLVTSGLDGVFPAGIPVAIVQSVGDLKEGGFFYDVEAKAAAGSLQDLQTALVLPPLEGIGIQ